MNSESGATSDGPQKVRWPNVQPIEPDSPMWVGIMGGVIAAYRSYVTQREFQPTEQHKANFDRYAREARIKWRAWQGEDSLHEMAFGEPFFWLERPGTPLFSAPLPEITCPSCDQFIRPTQHYLAYPTVHCWNCGHTFAAPNSWRDWKPEPDFIARMEEEAAQRDAERQYGPSTVSPLGNSREIPHGRRRIKGILLTQISPLDGSILFAILFAMATRVATFISTASRR